MAHQDVFDLVLLVERVVDLEHRAAGVTPDELDALCRVRIDEDVSPHHVGR
jgi:hypothetical protein